MNARTTTMSLPRLLSFRTLGWLAVALMLAAALLPVSGVRPVLASHVDPTPISNNSNPTCGDFGAWLEVKSDPPGNEVINVPGFGTITVSGFGDNSFDWSSTFGIDAVLVKAGSSKHNLYVYNPESMGDTDLVPQAGQGNGISHISFCYDVDPTPTVPPTDEPTTPPTDEPTTPPTDEPTTPPTDEPTTPPTDEPTTPPTDEPTPTPEASVGGETATPEASVGGATATPRATLPPTDTLGTTGTDNDALRIMLVVLAGILASVLVLTPSRSAARRR